MPDLTDLDALLTANERLAEECRVLLEPHRARLLETQARGAQGVGHHE